MRYAILENDQVVNIIEADLEFIESHDLNAVELNDSIGIGWSYVDGSFIAPASIQVTDETTPE
jgi:hypothetical protein